MRTLRWRALAASGSCLVAAGSLGGCEKTAPDRGGLMLMVSSEGPLVLDHLEIEIVSNDQSLLANNYRVPDEVRLPTTVAIVSNGNATAQVKISVTGWAKDVPLDRRDRIVSQIPNDRVAALSVVLSARCSDKLSVNDEGKAVSSCGKGNTCDNLGICVPAEVQAAELPSYQEGDENEIGQGGAGPDDAQGGSSPGGSSPVTNSSGGTSTGGTSTGGTSTGGTSTGGTSTGGTEPEVTGGEGGNGGAAGSPAVDPCADVVCDTPPEPDHCLSTEQFKDYEKPGSCVEGECKYTPHVTDCDCENDNCTEDLCESVTCASSVCVLGTCRGVCAPPQTQCSGTTPQTCNANGAWDDQPVTVGQCAAACTPGTTQCSSLKAQQTCNASGVWPAAVNCTNQTCVGTGVGSACTGECAQGQSKCSGTDRQTCTTAGKWSAPASCAAPQTCQGGACTCPASTPNLCNANCTNYQTDKFNCGSCGHDCQGGPCVGGACQPFALYTHTTETPAHIAVSSTKVYWTTTTSTAVYSVPLSGLVGLFPDGVSLGGVCGIMGLAIDSTNLYGIARGTNPVHCEPSQLSAANLMTAPLAGGAATKVNTGSDLGFFFVGQSWRCLAVDAANAYYTHFETDEVFRIPKSGGTPVQMWKGTPKYAMGIAVEGANVYWGTRNSNGIMKQPISGGSNVAIAPAADAYFLAVDGSYIYYTNSGALMKTLTAGSTPVTLVASGAVGPVAIDANNVYYLGASTVMRVPKLGGSPTTLASGQTAPSDIAVDATSVYWLTSTAVMKLAL